MLKLLAGSGRALWLVMAACVLGSFTVYTNIGLMAASAWLISAAALHPSVAELSIAIVGVRFFGLSRAVCRYIERYIGHEFTFRLLADIRIRLYAKLEPLLPAGLAGIGKGDVFSRMVADVETLQFFYLRAVFPLGIAVIVIVTVIGLLGWLAPWLVWPVAGAFLLVSVSLPAVIYCLGRKAGQNVIAARTELNIVLTDSIDGITELAAWGQTLRQTEKLDAANKLLTARQRQANAIAVLAEAMANLGMNLTVIAVIVFTAPVVFSGELPGVYLAVLALMVQASFEAILPLSTIVHYLQASVAAFTRIAAITSQKPVVGGQGKITTLTEPVSVVVDRLSFAYSSNLPVVLSDISFTLPPGKRLAIIGESGTGKSTLAGLMLRFWDYNHGSILLNSQDSREYAPEAVRQTFSVVSQDTYLFNATIRDNILLAKPDATPSELASAIDRAMLSPFIAKLPYGLDTRTGQNGLAVSGGERQRIALARALLKAAPIWLLDEPTAGLDAQTEEVVMKNILEAAGSRSVVLITHRLTGLETMDEILVLQNGKIAEQGSLRELLLKLGLFSQIWDLQHDMLNIS
ncbi:putative ABC transporter ATP-binding/permease protein [Sporomusa rhizae]|uniref:thiol reductant ABC exporter subunit CydC n=1 Tax=Sporomusa rhizae TaxID=357999 RepID=UPI00352B21F4